MAASTGVYKSMSIGVNKLIGVFSVRIDTIKAYRASFDQWLPLASRHQHFDGLDPVPKFDGFISREQFGKA